MVYPAKWPEVAEKCYKGSNLNKQVPKIVNFEAYLQARQQYNTYTALIRTNEHTYHTYIHTHTYTHTNPSTHTHTHTHTDHCDLNL